MKLRVLSQIFVIVKQEDFNVYIYHLKKNCQWLKLFSKILAKH